MAFPDPTEAVLRRLLNADPGLPRPDGSPSFWQQPEHKIGSVQSSSLPEKSDVVIIGSGITGASVARSILKTTDQTSVTVLEARTLCSGATGRNGGNLLSPLGLLYTDLRKAVGKDMALKVIDFTNKTVSATKEAVEEYAPSESQVRAVTRVYGYKDQGMFERAKQSVLDYEDAKSAAKGTHIIISGDRASDEFRIHGTVGAILVPAYSVWPYRFILGVWERLLEGYPHRLKVEANTPVVHIAYEAQEASTSHPYVIHTPRGLVRAARIVHCTNGYASHLLQPLRGIVYPCRETMTVQDLGTDKRDLLCWGIIQRPEVDPRTGAMTSELLYLQQNMLSGHYYFGGGFNTPAEIVTADDSIKDQKSTEYLQGSLCTLLQTPRHKNKLVSTWTGVQGMTPDGSPLVGRLPSALTGRNGSQEWIAAAFNGGGMCMCWLAGEAVAEMMTEGRVPAYLPEVMLLSKERLDEKLTREQSVRAASVFVSSHNEPKL